MMKPNLESSASMAVLDASQEQALLAFERLWQSTPPPSIQDFALGSDESSRRRLAQELVLIDIEFRWRASAQGEPLSDLLGGRPSWHDYACHVVEIGPLAQVPPELVAEEYRIRRLWGEPPSHDGFISTYPTHLTRLPRWLSRIDYQLRADGVAEPVPHSARPVSPAGPDPRAPLPWSDYVLEQHLGGGGFGKVYRAVQKSLERQVAVKALHKSLQRDAESVDQFVQEARLLARLNHPGIVGVHGLGRYPGGGYFLVLDFIDGQDLQQRIDQQRLFVEEAVQITISAAHAIQHAHERGVIHGDLKPSNVLFDSQGQVSVTDFGLAQLASDLGTPHDRQPIQGGTPAYLAPEIASGERASIAVDIYGLGALLYALLTRRAPRQGTAQSIQAELKSNRPPTPPADLREGISTELETVVMKCLDGRAECRYPTAAEVASALAGCVT